SLLPLFLSATACCRLTKGVARLRTPKARARRPLVLDPLMPGPLSTGEKRRKTGFRVGKEALSLHSAEQLLKLQSYDFPTLQTTKFRRLMIKLIVPRARPFVEEADRIGSGNDVKHFTVL
ncbi:MAG: hypothetical protein ACUVTH_01610, partial [Thermogutta sp.]